MHSHKQDMVGLICYTINMKKHIFILAGLAVAVWLAGFFPNPAAAATKQTITISSATSTANNKVTVSGTVITTRNYGDCANGCTGSYKKPPVYGEPPQICCNDDGFGNCKTEVRARGVELQVLKYKVDSGSWKSLSIPTSVDTNGCAFGGSGACRNVSDCSAAPVYSFGFTSAETYLPGSHTVYVHAEDEAGNIPDASKSFTIAAAPKPTCTLTASPNKSDPGQSVKLEWTTANSPDSCSGSVTEGDGAGWAGTSLNKSGGNKNVTPSILPTTYKLTCENESGNGSCTARVTALAGDKQIFVNSNQSNTDFGFGGQGQIPSNCQPYNTTSGGDNPGDGAYQWSCSGPNIDLNGVDSGFNASAKSGYNITRQDCTVALSTANCTIEYTAITGGGGCPAGQKKGYTYCGGGGNCKASTDNSCGEDSCDNDNDCQSSGDVYVKVDGAQTSWTIDGPDSFNPAGTGMDIHYGSAPWGQYTINANPVFGMNQDFVKACRDAPAGGIDESTCVGASSRNIKNASGKKILTFWIKYSATQQQHLECQSQSCVVVQGAGSDQCAPEGSQCGGGGDVDNAEYVTQVIPAEMCTGQQYITSVTMKNTGTTDWQNSEPGPYRLAHDSDWTWGYPRMDLPGGTVVRPGESYTFTKTVTAPGFVATFDWWWSMIRETMFGFGQQSPSTQVRTIDCGGGGCQAGQTRPYTACVGQTCASIDACGASSCASDADCGVGPVTHTECQAQSCVSVAGAGANQCASDGDCGGGGPGGGEGGGGIGLPGGREEECSNQIDDDVNTKVDCQESACGGTQSCGGFSGSCSMSANPEKIIKTPFGNPGSLLSWNCAGATGCNVDNGVGAVGDVGSKQVYPETTTTYNLQCNEVGATATVFVRVYNWLLKEIRPQ